MARHEREIPSVKRLVSSLGLLLVISGVVGAVASCTVSLSKPPPSVQFYFPSGLVHVDSQFSPEGLLYVSNANFDKRFESGSVMALNLSKVGLPPFGAPVASAPLQLPRLMASDAGIVEIASFAGEMRALDLGEAGVRLFVATRSEGMKLHALTAPPLTAEGQDPELHCFTPPGTSAQDCATNAVSLSPAATETSLTGIPRAPGPFGLAFMKRVCDANTACEVGSCVGGACLLRREDGSTEPVYDVLVTHISQADTPLGSGKLPRGYLVRLDSATLRVDDSKYINLGAGATNSVAAGAQWAYLSGRFVASTDNLPLSNLLRLVDRTGGVLSSGIEGSFRVAEARGLALSTDETRVYIAARAPDSLLVASVTNANSKLAPGVAAARAVPLPQEPNEVRVISRPGRSDLVAITCSAAGTLALYDDEVGDVVAQVSGVGVTPFDMAIDRRGEGARIFISNFGDGRVAVVDIPDLGRPQDARLVAHLGVQQLCLTQGQREPQLCDGGMP